ncbi:protein of unknown function [Nitrospira defluvii]|uniref:Uncharacterized protein n=1 Tax=Nitrospira defluvii TaxID=330214 RepID=D8PJ76_9BACT|nr:protein of unknown function [Nitrospira defluvii]
MDLNERGDVGRAQWEIKQVPSLGKNGNGEDGERARKYCARPMRAVKAPCLLPLRRW